MRAFIKRILPPPVTDRLRAVVDLGVAFMNRRRLRRAVRELRRAEGKEVPALVERLSRAWDNSGWVGNPLYLRSLFQAVCRTHGPILDLGSGLSTVLAGVAAERTGAEIWSLEQDPEWHRRMEEILSRLGIRNVNLVLAPLREYRDFLWYDVEGTSLPSDFHLVLCDGPWIPPGAYADRGRYGLLPVMVERVVTVRKILLDDVITEDVRRMLIDWDHEYGYRNSVTVTAEGNFGVAEPSQRESESPLQEKAPAPC